MRKVLAAIAVLALFVALVVTTVLYGEPRPSATPGHVLQAALYMKMLWVALVIFVIVEGLLMWFMVRYRERADS